MTLYFLFSLALASLQQTYAATKPNILILLADDQGYGDIGYNAPFAIQPGAGGKVYTPNPPRTPFLDSLAASPHTLVFDRFYSGSPVCSPTRASLLTGRTPDRECVFNAEGCGQEPAWSCVNPEPFPGGYTTGSGIFTLANAAGEAGYSTLHAGKFHLGDFFPKHNPSPTYAYKKWPVMHPGMLGFTEWFSTEASASSTMCNCGCDSAWPMEAPGCVLGGGVYTMNKSFPCTNYWEPQPPEGNSSTCLTPTTATLPCVTNYTGKIPGDDTLFLGARLGRFVSSATSQGTPWLATLQLHTNHIPHPALPTYYHAYNGSDGLPAGDYLGTLTQMDAGLAGVWDVLGAAGVDLNNTLVWYTADNGPHPGSEGDGAGGIPVKNTATNGLRQCKASVFEGGIRVPGFIHWPAGIPASASGGATSGGGASSRHTSIPAYVPDMLPTLMEVMGGPPHPHPEWAMDGVSLLPLIVNPPPSSSSSSSSITTTTATTSPWVRPKPLGWRLGSQVAWMSPTGQYKVVVSPDKGQCPQDASTYPYNSPTPLLFDLLADPTESHPLSGGGADAIKAGMVKELLEWQAGIGYSQVNESGCLPGGGGGGKPVVLHYGSPTGPCLTTPNASFHAPLYSSPPASCGVGIKKNPPTSSSTLPLLKEWVVDPATHMVTLADNSTKYTWCFHSQAGVCEVGSPVWLGYTCTGATAMTLDVGGSGELVQPGCANPPLCAGVVGGKGGEGEVKLVACSGGAGGQGWVPVPVPPVVQGGEAAHVTRGVYIQPFD